MKAPAHRPWPTEERERETTDDLHASLPSLTMLSWVCQVRLRLAELSGSGLDTPDNSLPVLGPAGTHTATRSHMHRDTLQHSP